MHLIPLRLWFECLDCLDAECFAHVSFLSTALNNQGFWPISTAKPDRGRDAAENFELLRAQR
jgi:hypothetical protein